MTRGNAQCITQYFKNNFLTDFETKLEQPSYLDQYLETIAPEHGVQVSD